MLDFVIQPIPNTIATIMGKVASNPATATVIL
jgi:hypothetical protein